MNRLGEVVEALSYEDWRFYLSRLVRGSSKGYVRLEKMHAQMEEQHICRVYPQAIEGVIPFTHSP